MSLLPTTQKKADLFESVIGAFNEIYAELRDLGKKKPEATLSAAKVKLINRVLEDVKLCMEGEAYAKYLDLLEDESLPQYSDAILVLSQYEGALKTFHQRHHGWHQSKHQWVIAGKNA